MKKITLLIISLSVFFSSCNYLDIVPDDTATLDDAFKNETTAEDFLFTCYSWMDNYNNFRDHVGVATSDEYSPAYHWGAQWFNFKRYQVGNDNASNPIRDLWASYYTAIKQCYMFLDNIDKVTPVFMNQDVYNRKKAEWIGEVYFLIAYYHHMLLQNYGPIVIVESNDAFVAQPRLPYDECVEKIAEIYDKALTTLPNTLQPADYGRASKTVAYAMKAKLLLFAASPLYNGNTNYADFKDREGKNLISQTKDNNKWSTAMTAIETAITHAEGQGHRLYTYTKEAISDPFEQAVANTRWVMVDNWNTEILWAYTGNHKESDSDGNANSFQRHAVPKGLSDRRYTESNPVGAVAPTLKTVKIFYSDKGLPPESDPSFPWNDRMSIAPGDSTVKLHRNREPRFYAAIGFDRGYYEFNGNEKDVLYLRYKEKNGCDQRGTDHLYAGYAVKKPIHPNGQANSSAWSLTAYAFPIVRLSDLYLAYAEACAEFQGSLNTKAKQYVNAVRTRAGIPNIEVSYGSEPSGQALVDAIRRERLIEFVFEAQWHFDLRRWNMSVNWHADERTGMLGLNEIGTTAADFYKETPMTESYFIFDQRNYLMPIKTEHVNTNGIMVQNPGW